MVRKMWKHLRVETVILSTGNLESWFDEGDLRHQLGNTEVCSGLIYWVTLRFI